MMNERTPQRTESPGSKGLQDVLAAFVPSHQKENGNDGNSRIHQSPNSGDALVAMERLEGNREASIEADAPDSVRNAQADVRGERDSLNELLPLICKPCQVGNHYACAGNCFIYDMHLAVCICKCEEIQ